MNWREKKFPICLFTGISIVSSCNWAVDIRQVSFELKILEKSKLKFIISDLYDRVAMQIDFLKHPEEQNANHESWQMAIIAVVYYARYLVSVLAPQKKLIASCFFFLKYFRINVIDYTFVEN